MSINSRKSNFKCLTYFSPGNSVIKSSKAKQHVLMRGLEIGKEIYDKNNYAVLMASNCYAMQELFEEKNVEIDGVDKTIGRVDQAGDWKVFGEILL